MAEAAQRTGRVLMEAFHYRFHPLMARALEIVRSGELGQVERITTSMCIPMFMRNDIRFRLDLAGGAMMDVGCYALHQLRTLAGAEPEVISAKAKLRAPGVDRAMEAELRFADGRTAHMECSLWSHKLLKLGFSVQGAEGELHVLNATVPQLYHRLKVSGKSGTRRERVPGEATYTLQLRNFAEAVQNGAKPLIGLDDSIANMKVIDAVYRAAGMSPRGVN
jgi:predicted dehydrogenase